MLKFLLMIFIRQRTNKISLSKNKHPLFKTRGVPGTHDINLIKKFFDFIKVKSKKFKKFKLTKV